ncbi:MAG TPA: biotin transporter BioY [Gemmatimonadaceae bacterium]|nr:biotin transporter BioY [Gemmatimonadaceae bacterium]
MKTVTVQSGVLTDTIWPNASIVRDAILVLGGSLLIALSAQLVIPLPFSPVPITGQTFAVLLLAALLGSKRGLATIVTYLALGLFGLPVFAGGAAGIARLVGPTAGYLMGYLPAAFVVGSLSERGWDRRLWSTALTMIVGNAIIYLTGALWLQAFVGPGGVLETGVLPFIPGDLLKIALATLILPLTWRFVGPRRARGSA